MAKRIEVFEGSLSRRSTARIRGVRIEGAERVNSAVRSKAPTLRVFRVATLAVRNERCRGAPWHSMGAKGCGGAQLRSLPALPLSDCGTKCQSERCGVLSQRCGAQRRAPTECASTLSVTVSTTRATPHRAQRHARCAKLCDGAQRSGAPNAAAVSAECAALTSMIVVGANSAKGCAESRHRALSRMALCDGHRYARVKQ